jgi:hypothetical protein
LYDDQANSPPAAARQQNPKMRMLASTQRLPPRFGGGAFTGRRVAIRGAIGGAAALRTADWDGAAADWATN